MDPEPDDSDDVCASLSASGASAAGARVAPKVGTKRRRKSNFEIDGTLVWVALLVYAPFLEQSLTSSRSKALRARVQAARTLVKLQEIVPASKQWAEASGCNILGFALMPSYEFFTDEYEPCSEDSRVWCRDFINAHALVFGCF